MMYAKAFALASFLALCLLFEPAADDLADFDVQLNPFFVLAGRDQTALFTAFVRVCGLGDAAYMNTHLSVF